jgi:hypothetical protein
VLGRLVLVACYAVALVVGVVLLNADAQNGWIAVAMLLIMLATGARMQYVRPRPERN